MKRSFATIAFAAMALLAAGCSQIDAYAPVSGGPKATVETAIGNVLASRSVAVLVRPDCMKLATTFECEGSTVDGSPILATSSAVAPFMLVITVGETVIFDDDAQEAINSAMREAP
jgi:hypothetical protein